jgi:D-alanine-D-alanine ligase
MARVDFFVNDQTQQIYFNEINTLPGFTSISMYPRMWQASGLSYSALLDCLVKLAMTYHQRRQQLVRHYQ